MNRRYNWFCYKTVLPKKGYDFVEENEEHISFYKEGQPIVVLMKSNSYHPTYTMTILNRIQITLDYFARLLSLCKAQQQR